MSEKSYVKDEDGNITHIRETSDDGRTSNLYVHDGSFFGELFSGGKGEHVEVAEHHENGSTDAYVPDNSFWGQLLNDGKGERK